MKDAELRDIVTRIGKGLRANEEVSHDIETLVNDKSLLEKAIVAVLTNEDLFSSASAIVALGLDADAIRCLSLVEERTTPGSEQRAMAQRIVADAIWDAPRKWAEAEYAAMETFLLQTPCDDQLTLLGLDEGLNGGLCSELQTACLMFIERYLTKSRKGCPSLKLFPQTTRGMRKLDGAVLSQLVTRWLLSGNLVLMKAVSELVSGANPPERDLGLNADLTLVNGSQVLLLALAERAIGWMSLNYRTCIGYVISCTVGMTKETLKFFESDFFFMLCINYSMEMKRALGPRKRDCRMGYYKFIKRMLCQAEVFWTKRDKLGQCPELSPTRLMRHEFQVFQSRRFAEANQESMEKAVILKLFPFIHLLHGHGTVTHVYDKDGNLHRDVSYLQHHHASVSLPIMSTVSSQTFESRLYHLRLWGVE